MTGTTKEETNTTDEDPINSIMFEGSTMTSTTSSVTSAAISSTTALTGTSSDAAPTDLITESLD